MRYQDLDKAKANGQTVAFVPMGRQDDDYAHEVRVLDTNGTRQVATPGLRMYRSHSSRGVLVEWVPGEGHEGEPRRETVSQVKLVALWADYVRDRDERRRQRQRSQQHREMSQADAERVAERVKARLTEAGKEFAYNAVEAVGIGGGHLGPGGRYRSPYAYGVRVAPELLEWLLDDE